jgi:hypothetical protein
LLWYWKSWVMAGPAKLRMTGEQIIASLLYEIKNIDATLIHKA